MLWTPLNAAGLFLLALSFLQSHFRSHCQAHFHTFPYPLTTAMTTMPRAPLEYGQPLFHLPQDKTEVIVVGDAKDQHHHHHHHHHHKHGHHHAHGHNHKHDHGHKHEHGHNHNHDHKHDHGHSHKHDHGHDHKHDHGHDHKHDHQHSHGHDHKHGHQHSHDHSHGHKHDHSHGHKHDHSHGHDHHHGHDHKHDHQHGHQHKNEHSHGHDHHHGHQHNHDHSHGHDHQHGHQHKNEHSHDHQHGHQHKSEHSHEHDHQHQNAHSQGHQHDHLSDHGHDHQHDHLDNHGHDHGNVDDHRHQRVRQHDKNHDFRYTHPVRSPLSHEGNRHGSNDDPPFRDYRQLHDSSPPTGQQYSNNDPPYEPEFEEPAYGDGPSSRPPEQEAENPYDRQRHGSNDLRNGRDRDPSDHKSDGDGKEKKDVVVRQYGSHLGYKSRDFPHQASISTVTFLQESGDIVTIGNDDPFLSIERPLNLVNDFAGRSGGDVSLESRLSRGGLSLTPATDYGASFGKFDEVWNIPLFD